MSILNEVINELRKRNFIFLIGNGGSAATCIHFANDLLSAGHKAMCLVDQSNITRIANDKDYKFVFVDQLRVLFSENDALIAISASGNSANLVEAVNYINSIGGLTVAIVGFDGGVLKKICTSCIHTSTEIGEYEEAENEHLKVCHQIAMSLR